MTWKHLLTLIPCAVLVAVVPARAGEVCNSPPEPSIDVVQVGYSSSHLFDPLHNDSDADGDPLVLSSIANPQAACRGDVSHLGQGLVRFAPDGGALPGGALSCNVSYQVSDGHLSRTGTVTLVFPPTGLFADDFESGSTAAWDEIESGS